MTVEKVPADQIEDLVGRKRHATEHYASARGDDFFILHSQTCLDAFEDLRECPYSRSLAKGVFKDNRFEIGPTRIAVGLFGLVPVDE